MPGTESWPHRPSKAGRRFAAPVVV
jgi:hypothetical protein